MPKMPKSKKVGGSRKGSGISSDPTIRARQLAGLASGREMYRESIKITDSEQFIRPISFRTETAYNWFKAFNPTQRGALLADEMSLVNVFPAEQMSTTTVVEFKSQSVSVRFKEGEGTEYLGMDPPVRGAYIELLFSKATKPRKPRKKSQKAEASD